MGAASDCDSPTGSSPRLREASRGSTTAEARVQRSGRGDPTRQTPAGGVLWVACDGSGCGSAERTRRSNRVEWPYAAERGLPWGQSRQPPPTAAGCDTAGRTCTETIDLLNVRNVAREHRREHGTRREPSPTQLRRGRVKRVSVLDRRVLERRVPTLHTVFPRDSDVVVHHPVVSVAVDPGVTLQFEEPVCHPGDERTETDHTFYLVAAEALRCAVLTPTCSSPDTRDSR